MTESRNVRVARVLALSALCVLAVGCRSWRGSCNDPVSYQSAQTVAPLKIPPGLQAPDNSNALRIPALNEPEPPPRDRKEGCLDSPPPFTTPKAPPPPSA